VVSGRTTARFIAGLKTRPPYGNDPLIDSLRELFAVAVRRSRKVSRASATNSRMRANDAPGVIIMRTALAGLICLSIVAIACAETVTLAERGTVIPYGETVDYAFTPAGDYQSVRLIISVRMDSAVTAGSTHVMGLEVNGEGVNGALSRTATRLLNKPLTVKT
jgi:hypothetical protein